jgi:hypothetical protein
MIVRMEILQVPRVNDIVLIKRSDRDGDRIPMEYRMYIADNTYIYKAKIVKIIENKPYNRVQPLPLSQIQPLPLSQIFTRKGYKTKIYKLPL